KSMRRVSLCFLCLFVSTISEETSRAGRLSGKGETNGAARGNGAADRWKRNRSLPTGRPRRVSTPVRDLQRQSVLDCRLFGGRRSRHCRRRHATDLSEVVHGHSTVSW